MGNAPPPGARDALAGELYALIEIQKKNYHEYLRVLDRENEAVEGGDDEALDLCRKMETERREKIVSTERSLRALSRDAARTPAGARAEAGLAAARGELEALRLKAVAANNATQDRLRRKMKEVKNELDALGATLRRLSGGNARSGDDPLFIDVYS
jgi:hypothetical protein